MLLYFKSYNNVWKSEINFICKKKTSFCGKSKLFHGLIFCDLDYFVFNKQKTITRLLTIFGISYKNLNCLKLPLRKKRYLIDTKTESTFNTFIKPFNYSVFKQPFWFEFATNFFFIVSQKNFKTIYSASYGNYLTLLLFDFKKNYYLFVLPSKKKLVLTSSILVVPGRKHNFWKKYHIAAYNKLLLKHKRRSVRGVAMNPVDHHNGGEVNRKPLFLNKYNKIAKHNK